MKSVKSKNGHWNGLTLKPTSFQARVLTNPYLPKPIRYSIVVAANWLFHGFLYMDTTEKVFFLILDLVLFVPLFLMFLAITNLVFSVTVSAIIAHTLHFFFNGHFYVLLKNLGHSEIGFARLKDYMNGLVKRANGKNEILAIVAYGSLSRHQLSESSDLDVRIFRQDGAINGLKACIFTFTERSRALLRKIPLDVYAFDGFRSLDKIDPSEPPAILYDPKRKLRDHYEKV